jgi:hypothetical protein
MTDGKFTNHSTVATKSAQPHPLLCAITKKQRSAVVTKGDLWPDEEKGVTGVDPTHYLWRFMRQTELVLLETVS